MENTETTCNEILDEIKKNTQLIRELYTMISNQNRILELSNNSYSKIESD